MAAAKGFSGKSFQLDQGLDLQTLEYCGGRNFCVITKRDGRHLIVLGEVSERNGFRQYLHNFA